MPGVIASLPKFQFSANGVPMVGGTLTAYIAGSTTPATTWQDAAMSIANTNPITLDARGECVLWLDSTVSYKFILKNASGVIQWTQDNIASGAVMRTDLAGVTGTSLMGGTWFGGVVATIATLAGSAGASLLGFIQSSIGAVARSIQDKLRESVSAKDFGCIGNGVADDTAALAKVVTAAMSGVCIHFPKGVYLTSQPLNFTSAVNITADIGARIKLTAAGAYVMQINLTGTGAFWGYGASLKNLILDGGGLCADGLVLKGVISSDFINIRATNVTGAGLHLAWAQCCTFTNYTCSRNVEAFTTTPVNGLLIDGQTSSANTFVNLVVEHVSGSGVKGLSMINTVFLNGTSEGNNIGLEFGAAVSIGWTSVGNTVIGMDLEVNAAADIVLRATANANTFIGLGAGYGSPAVQIQGSYANNFYGGLTSGFDFDAASHDNTIDGVKLLGAGSIIVNAGTRNSWRNVWNISTAAVVADSGLRSPLSASVGNGLTLAINAKTTSWAIGIATGPTATVGMPTNPVDGMQLDVTIRNESAGATAITWSTAFKIGGWVNPANASNRTARFIYSSANGFWYAVAVSSADVPN